MGKQLKIPASIPIWNNYDVPDAKDAFKVDDPQERTSLMLLPVMGFLAVPCSSKKDFYLDKIKKYTNQQGMCGSPCHPLVTLEDMVL